MLSGFAEDFDEEVGGSVDHLWVGGEVGLGVNVAGQANDLFDGTEAAHFGFDDGEASEEGCPRGGLSRFEITLAGDFPFEGLFSDDGEATRNMEEVSATDAVDIRANGGCCGREIETEFSNFFFRSHRRKVWCGCL